MILEFDKSGKISQWQEVAFLLQKEKN